ncbi:hypothetical protein AVEN_208046-1 [Araneus ventricosus]|uniref:Uncharacterized protein n=1 Tax=Araneus ventricosus TaxID=182803 RepID=A0A4Y2F442_ARAVE|nr:hypothetical protein AVEN_208046-1 [Araneus ventricosus]
MTDLFVASNKNHPVPARTTWVFMNNRPPRQNIGHSSPHYERLMRGLARFAESVIGDGLREPHHLYYTHQGKENPLTYPPASHP